MRASEFLKEEGSSGASVAGSMAPISQSLGSPIKRLQPIKPAKYRNSLYKGQQKTNARR